MQDDVGVWILSRRLIAAYSALVLGVSVGITAAAGPAHAAASLACADVGIIGARGSGDKQVASDSRLSGFGQVVQTAVTQVAAKLGTRNTIKAFPVTYPAGSVSLLSPTPAEVLALRSKNPVTIANATASYAIHMKSYFDGLNVGVNGFDALLTGQASACPNEKFVIIGFSQGAMAAHQLLLRLEQQKRSGLLGRIASVVLVGDGDRTPNTAAALLGSAPRSGEGLRPYFKLTRQDIPSRIAKRTYEICNAKDIVCDFKASNLVSAASAVLVHTKSYPGSAALDSATTRTVNTLKSWLPASSPFVVRGTSGKTLKTQLPTSYLPTSAKGLTWSTTVGNLPQGLTLSSQGVVAGTPSGPAAKTLVLKVRDTPNNQVYVPVRFQIDGPVALPTSESPRWVVEPSAYTDLYDATTYWIHFSGSFSYDSLKPVAYPRAVFAHVRQDVVTYAGAATSSATELDGISQTLNNLDITVCVAVVLHYRDDTFSAFGDQRCFLGNGTPTTVRPINWAAIYDWQ